MCDIRVYIALRGGGVVGGWWWGGGGGGGSENVYREFQCTLLVQLQCGGGGCALNNIIAWICTKASQRQKLLHLESIKFSSSVALLDLLAIHIARSELNIAKNSQIISL